MPTLRITITVGDGENATVHTHAEGVSEAEIRPLLQAAADALAAEIGALEECPFHQRAQPNTDLVCTVCRWRGGHSPDCPHHGEPWPTMGETA